jgi:hypothetical protein
LAIGFTLLSFIGTNHIKNSYLGTVDPSELGVEKQYFEELLTVCESFERGLRGHMKKIVSQLLNAYLETEGYFQEVSYDKGVSAIKTKVSDVSRTLRMVNNFTFLFVLTGFLIKIFRSIHTLACSPRTSS